MPAKKSVRFLIPTKQRRPPPPFAYSSSTRTSSAPPTPPHHPHLPLPHPQQFYPAPYPPLPVPRAPSAFPKAPSSAFHPQPVTLHSYLVPHRRNRPNSELIQWNMLDYHSMAIRGRHNLFQPASQPPLSYIRILIRMNVSSHHPHPFWVCRVHASNHPYVTVWDVLESLYNSLRRNITQAEFDSLSEHDRVSASRSYKKRYGRLQDYDSHLSGEEKRLGMKRIDFLMGRTRFGGLSPGQTPDEFHLNLT